ncbi:Kelch repeat-containing protein [Microbulbifer sp. SA54]|uniref:Kelch repeat-containing protein n=1 Tax=Microbulbifer sp. SA54 TaxID=3401577 RepID=UPI003AAC2B3A
MQWRSGIPLPRAMQEIYPTLYRGEIYVGGGLGQAAPERAAMGTLAPMRQVLRFENGRNTWVPIPQLPAARHHLGLVADSEYLYGIGGFAADRQDPWQFSDAVFRWRAGDSHWQTGPALPAPQAESCYTCSGNRIHVIGGRTPEGDTGRHWRLTAGHWEEAAPLPKGRNSAASAVIDGQIYVIGGRLFAREHENQTSVDRYDPVANRWVSVRPLPVATAGTAAAVLSGEIYVFGGEAWVERNTESERWITYREVWCYNPQSDHWRLAGDMPSGRHGMGAVAMADAIYLLGGALGAGIDRTQDRVDILSV